MYRPTPLVGYHLSSGHTPAAEVIKNHKLCVPVWIERRLVETVHDIEERFALVIFSDYEVRELAPYLGVRLTIVEF